MGAYRIVEIGIRQIDGTDVNFPFVILYCRYALPGGFDFWIGKIPWRRKWQPTPVFLPGKSH